MAKGVLGIGVEIGAISSRRTTSVASASVTIELDLSGLDLSSAGSAFSTMVPS